MLMSVCVCVSVRSALPHSLVLFVKASALPIETSRERSGRDEQEKVLEDRERKGTTSNPAADVYLAAVWVDILLSRDRGNTSSVSFLTPRLTVIAERALTDVKH